MGFVVKMAILNIIYVRNCSEVCQFVSLCSDVLAVRYLRLPTMPWQNRPLRNRLKFTQDPKFSIKPNFILSSKVQCNNTTYTI